MSHYFRVLCPLLVCIGCLAGKPVTQEFRPVGSADLIQSLDSYIVKTVDPGDERFAELAFIDRSGLKLGSLTVHLPYEIKNIRSAAGPLLAVTYYSGGESGCCNQMDFVLRKGETLKTTTISETAYADAPSIRDIDQDGIDELITTNTDFYGLADKSNECRLTPGIHEGISNLRFPNALHVVSTKDGLSLEDVTFDPKLQSLIDPGLREVAGNLRSKMGETIECSSNPDLAAYMQYAHYMQRLNREVEGTSNVKNSKIQLKCQCLAKQNQPLVDFLKSTR
ncbi:MAG: hypothetical protein K8S54_02355 [Spirochaetia bacterium]|nr:hypothetical protein [Spirochaetia bacterium]